MDRRRMRLMRGVCRMIGHRWVWRLTEDGWPYHECTRCGSGWELGRPIDPKDENASDR
jgi:hypothetical protein